MTKKILIPLRENDVAPRFDLAAEVMFITLDPGGRILGSKTLVLPHASAEDLCHLILTEDVDTVVCGGIEDEYYQYLTWKKVNILDSVMGPWENALEQLRLGSLKPGAILFERPERSRDV